MADGLVMVLLHVWSFGLQISTFLTGKWWITDSMSEGFRSPTEGFRSQRPREEWISTLAEPWDDTLILVLCSETQQILGGDL